ncbi:hypothetical protein [Bacillus atrophaeus]|uniref:hypothetical protein n=1 Tax=Bacillus atrophaeus TaxID=1452 RepID=UPI00227F83B8|nr:hypothetical protein [Bacillus atrophaeus]MCY8958182.1 hypothetical protein [Bacillus atrophaeus]MCY8963755.1 hypothetical protein [Bacillus atrophaeus]MCY9161183.1 hypothetical protein [Bacillus atrophaeus]MCY9440225.1 hypothetical protein [Bacillus atrophaeus]MEC0648505.1 hypothetical protein [Bacillus atrophaeus]
MDSYESNLELLNKIDKRLRRFNLKSKLELLRVLHHSTSLLHPNDDFLKRILPNNIYRKQLRGNLYNHELGYLSLASIVAEEWSGETRNISYNDLRKILMLYRNYNIPFRHEDDADLADHEIITQFSVRAGLQQFIYQRNHFKSFYRYYYLFNYISSKTNIKKTFLEVFGYEYEDYLLFSWVLYIYSSRTWEINKTNLKRTIAEVLHFSDRKIETLLNSFSITREEFIDLYRKFATTDSKMKVYDFNPLLMKPIVTDKDSDFLLPMPFTIFIAVTEGMFQQLCTVKGLSFKSDFGKHAYEDYIEHILKIHNYDYIKEFEYRFQKNNLRSPDLMLVKDDHVIFIELKARVPMISLRTTNYKKYKQELRISLGAALAQCFKKEKHLKSGFITHEKLPDKISKISHIAITLEEFNVADEFGLEEAIKNNGGELSNSRYHVMSTGTLESILEEDPRDIFQYCMDREEAGTTNIHLSEADIIRDKRGDNLDLKLMEEIIKKVNL